MDGAISLIAVASMPLAAVRRQVTPATLWPEAMKAPLWTLTQRRGLTTSGHMVFVYHDHGGERLINRPAGVAVDIGVVVDHPFDGDRVLQCVMTPSGRVAHTRHAGHYELLPAIHGDIRAWCLDEGHEIAGTNWEHYGVWHEEPERRITDVYYLLRDSR